MYCFASGNVVSCNVASSRNVASSSGTVEEPNVDNPTHQPHSPFNLLLSRSYTRLQFIRACLQHKGINITNASYLTSSVRTSTQSQYEHVWKVFCQFCHSKDFSKVTDNLIISFFDHLIRIKGLKAKTLLSYKSALIDPLKYGFNFDITNDIITKSLRGMANLYPETRYRAPDWSLDLVLQYIVHNNHDNSLLFNTRKTLFLVGLALGSRVSELFALMRDKNSLSRRPDGSFEIYQDPQFLAKNEDPLNRRGPVIINPLPGDSNVLCPCKSLSNYLNLTKKTKSSHLFVHPVHLGKWNLAAMRLAIVRFIKSSQPLSLARAHDLRKVATSLAFFSKMNIDTINKKMGWKSRKVFLKHYLHRVKELHHRCSTI